MKLLFQSRALNNDKAEERTTRKAGDEKEIKNQNDSINNTSSKETKKANAENTKKSAKDEKDLEKETVQADMANPNMHIKDQDPNVIDLGFGVKIDINQNSLDQEIRNPDQTPNGFVPPIQQPNPNMMNPNIPNPQQYPNMNPGYSQQHQYDPNDPAIKAYNLAYAEFVRKQQQAAAIKSGRGNHKVDNPQPPKPPIIKSGADNINVDISAIKIDAKPPKPKKEMPDVVPSEAIVDATAAPVVDEKPVFDNSIIKNKYRYLGDIEKIAIDNRVQVLFKERLGLDGNPNGLIDVISYTEGSNQPNSYKCFTIDTGSLYDKRAKVFPGIVQYGYEDMNAYSVLIPKNDEDKSKSKSKNEINFQLFDNIFKGGIQMLDGMRGMYSNEMRELNKCIALITMPTKNMDADTRKKIKDRLFAAMRGGVFKKAFDMEPNSRFIFKSYDKKTKCFTLSNVGVPKYFGTLCVSKGVVEINFGIDQTTVTKLA